VIGLGDRAEVPVLNLHWLTSRRRSGTSVLLKLEHTYQRGRWAGGAERAEENQTAAEAVVRF